MKKSKVSLFIFIDAFGWEILKRHPAFLKDLLVDRKKLRTILGYSSACDPSIISGKLPSQHGLWSSFYYSPETSPFKWVKWLNYFPFTHYQRVRNWLSTFIKKIHGFTGYFQIYQVPWKDLPLFDYAEKKRIWAKQGLPRAQSIFDQLTIPYYVGDQEGSDERQLQRVEKLLKAKSIAWAYLLMGKLDGLMHAVGTRHQQIDDLLEWYDRQIRHLYQVAQENYETVNLYIFSDHGMHDVKKTYDLQKEINSLNLQYGKDYVALYDSTMARFWYLNEHAKKKILSCLHSISAGRIIAEDELKQLGVYFPDHQYGDTIFLMHEGILIIPSFMGLNRIEGMHGYHPDEPDSVAMICSNRPLPSNLTNIEHIYDLLSKT